MKTGVDQQQMRDLEKKLKVLGGKDAKKVATKGTRVGAKSIVLLARKLAPRDTGEGRKTVKWHKVPAKQSDFVAHKFGRESMYVQHRKKYSDEPHMPHIDAGYKKTAGVHFIARAAEAAGEEALQIVVKEFEREIEKVW